MTTLDPALSKLLQRVGVKVPERLRSGFMEDQVVVDQLYREAVEDAARRGCLIRTFPTTIRSR